MILSPRLRVAGLLRAAVPGGQYFWGFFVVAAACCSCSAALAGVPRLHGDQGRLAPDAADGDRRGAADQGDVSRRARGDRRRGALMRPLRGRRRRSARRSRPTAASSAHSLERLRGEVAQLTDWRSPARGAPASRSHRRRRRGLRHRRRHRRRDRPVPPQEVRSARRGSYGFPAASSSVAAPRSVMCQEAHLPTASWPRTTNPRPDGPHDPRTEPLVLRLGDEVAAALARGGAVVALESTIIAHGLPRPDNLEVAAQLEDAVRAAGAVPATIAVLDGEPSSASTRGAGAVVGGGGRRQVRRRATSPLGRRDAARRGDDGRRDRAPRRAGRHPRVRHRRARRRAPRRRDSVGRVGRPRRRSRGCAIVRRVRGREVDPRRPRDARAAGDAERDRARATAPTRSPAST